MLKNNPKCWLCQWQIEEWDKFPTGEYPWYLKNHADKGPIHEECGYLRKAAEMIRASEGKDAK